MKFIKSLHINNLFFYLLYGVAVCVILSFFLPVFAVFSLPLFFGLLLMFLVDIGLLYGGTGTVSARRDAMDKLSNGDINKIQILVENTFLFPVKVNVIDELPFQFQKRDVCFNLTLLPGVRKIVEYNVRPLTRGEYDFGSINLLVKSPLQLIIRRFCDSQHQMVPVYPSFMQMHKYELMAISNRLQDVGIKRIRRIAQNKEFEQITDYVQGDDIRTINWKATASQRKIMVNHYQDERSQPVYTVIDMGRLMQMPFNGLSLLDYAINAGLVLSNIALYKKDRVGLITFSDKVHTLLSASSRNKQLHLILETLYNQRTDYLESDYENLTVKIKTKLNQRGLLLLFTNFHTLSGMRRQLPYLRMLRKNQLLVVIFFENTEMEKILNSQPANTDEIYRKTVAEKFAFEKKQIVKELLQYGIQSILTSPEKLTVNTINKYLELKSRGQI